MDQQRLNYLFSQYLSDQLSEEEKTEWFEVLDDPANQQDVDDLSLGIFQRKDLLKYQMDDVKAKEVLEYIMHNPQLTVTKIYSLWKRIAGVAAAVAFIAYGIYFFDYRKNRPNIVEGTRLSNDVKPGRNSAILTLSNGNKIILSDASNGNLANQAGVTITKEPNGLVAYKIHQASDSSTNLMNTLSTANGESYALILPDQTKVWLNSASSLTYAASLTRGGERSVELTGEAFFEVAKDKEHPFIVRSGNQKVKVLGTRFDINSYENEPSIKTTLMEGSVLVTARSMTRKLKPGEQSAVLGSDITINQVDSETVVDWKNGDFVLKGQDFKTFMRKVARWYNVDIVYDPSIPPDIELRGWISRNNYISSVLKAIEATGSVHFKIQGRKIYVSE